MKYEEVEKFLRSLLQEGVGLHTMRREPVGAGQGLLLALKRGCGYTQHTHSGPWSWSLLMDGTGTLNLKIVTNQSQHRWVHCSQENPVQQVLTITREVGLAR